MYSSTRCIWDDVLVDTQYVAPTQTNHVDNTTRRLLSSMADPECFDADVDLTFQADVDPDPKFV